MNLHALFTWEKLSNDCSVVVVKDAIGKRRELFYVGTTEEAAEITNKLNAAILEFVVDPTGESE